MDIRQEVKVISDQLGLDKEKTIGLSYALENVVKRLVKKQVANKNSELLFGDKPLHDVDSELALIGLTIKFPEQSRDKTTSVTSEYFFSEKNAIIWEAIQFIRESGYETSTSLIKSFVKSRGHEEFITDSFIDSLPVGYNDSGHIGQYLEMVSGLYQLRSLINICQMSIEKAYQTSSADAIGLKSMTIVEIEQIQDVSHVDKFDTSESIIQQERERLAKQRERLANNEKLLGEPTSIGALDRRLLGFWPANNYVVAARPGMGKSAFAIKVFWNLVRKMIPAAFFSLEMPTTQIVGRCWALEYERNSEEWRLGEVSEEEEEAFYEIIEELPAYIDDQPALSIDEFETRATYLVKEKGVRMIIIDYLQLMQGHSSKKYGSNREQEVSDISKKIKEIAKKLNVPIMPLCQLSRAVETRGGSKRPQLSDLRESGAIEQDADVVMFLYRPEYYNIIEDEEGNSLIGLGEIIVAKFREGALGPVKCSFDSSCVKWGDYEELVFQQYKNESVENNIKMYKDDLNVKNFDDLFGDDADEW